jgi:hypothetical protein
VADAAEALSRAAGGDAGAAAEARVSVAAARAAAAVGLLRRALDEGSAAAAGVTAADKTLLFEGREVVLRYEALEELLLPDGGEKKEVKAKDVVKAKEVATAPKKAAAAAAPKAAAAAAPKRKEKAAKK